MAQVELTRTTNLIVVVGQSVQVCTLGNDQPISGTLEDYEREDDGSYTLLIDAGNWLWRVPMSSVTAWATYGRTPDERF